MTRSIARPGTASARKLVTLGNKAETRCYHFYNRRVTRTRCDEAIEFGSPKEDMMKLLPRIAAAALIGLGIGAIDASAQNAPAPQGPAPAVAAPSPLTADQVKTVITGRLVTMRSDLHVGKVADRDANTFEVELLKPDNTVSERVVVDKLFAQPAGALSHHGRHGMHHGPHGMMGECGPGMGMGGHGMMGGAPQR